MKSIPFIIALRYLFGKKSHSALHAIAMVSVAVLSIFYFPFQKSVPIKDRLKGTWTLGQYEKNYTLAFAAAVKAANPGWKNGDPFDTSILDSVTRESVDASLVKSNGQYGEVLTRGLDISV